MRVYHLLKALKMIDEHFFITSRTHVSKEIMLSVVHIKIKSVISIFVLWTSDTSLLTYFWISLIKFKITLDLVHLKCIITNKVISSLKRTTSKVNLNVIKDIQKWFSKDATEVQRTKIKTVHVLSTYHPDNNQVTNYEGNHLVVELKWMTQSRDSHHHCKLLSPLPPHSLLLLPTWMSLSSPPLVVVVKVAIVCQVPLGGHLISSSSHHQVLNCLRCPPVILLSSKWPSSTV